MSAVSFNTIDHYKNAAHGYELLPFRFARIPGLNEILLTSEVGEYAFIPEETLSLLVAGSLTPQDKAYDELLSKQFLQGAMNNFSLKTITSKYRTKKSTIKGGPSLHIFVVSLRCDHSCPYCQVSRQNVHDSCYDMTKEMALNAIERLFECPSPDITLEFQGGEPLLAYDMIKFITDDVSQKNKTHKKRITFSITSTLHFINDEILEFFREHNFQVSTSLDGPEFLHNKNRPKGGSDSYCKTISMLQKTREALGIENVAALTTLTKLSLGHPKEIIDEYVRLGFKSIFLRPLSPYGFATRSEHKIGYNIVDFTSFYKEALSYILKLNLDGIVIEESYTSILLAHILTPFPTGYVDLRSPTGSGLGVIVYNYNGSVYASDESRMLAEMGDTTFRLGSVNQSYKELMSSDAISLILATSVAESLPGCSDCAFLPYCGADPVFHWGRQGDPVGYRSTSEFCRKHTDIFNILFKYIAEKDPKIMNVFWAWATRKNPSEYYMSEVA